MILNKQTAAKMKSNRKRLLLLAALIFGFMFTEHAYAEEAPPKNPARGPDTKQVDHGRYLSIIGGCNDCHTPGYLLSEGKVPERLWLTGDRFGWRGPWGTTYAANLRIFVNAMTKDQWVKTARTLKARPPMPWFDLNIMKEGDLEAVYQFIRYMGASGGPSPAYLPPDEEPTTPYALFP
jgi:mono/diheme cytochrome c family protein